MPTTIMSFGRRFKTQLQHWSHQLAKFQKLAAGLKLTCERGECEGANGGANVGSNDGAHEGRTRRVQGHAGGAEVGVCVGS